MIKTKGCNLSGKFKLWEKLYAQLSFMAMGILGSIGIIQVNWIWFIPYFLIFWYSVPGILMRYLACQRCVHLFEFGDCLQFPVMLTKRIVKGKKYTPFNLIEKIGFYLILTLVPIYPIYWLLENKPLLILFLIAVVTWYAGQFLHFCKRCRVKECPFNKAISLI